MATTVSTIKTRIKNILNRTDIDTHIDSAFSTVYEALQQDRDWKKQEAVQRTLASAVTYQISLPSDYKSPNPRVDPLIRIVGTVLTVDLVPTSFYEMTSFENILLRRKEGADVDSEDTGTPKSFAIFNDKIEIFPKNLGTDDHFAFLYLKTLSEPASAGSDWFTDHGFDLLMYDSLIYLAPLLGEVDDRVPVWNIKRIDAFNRVMGLDIALRYAGQDLVMYG